MSATYIDFDPELQALGYRAKTWDGRYYTVVAPDGEQIGTTPFEDEIKGYAETHKESKVQTAIDTIPAPIFAAYTNWRDWGFDAVHIAKAIEVYLREQSE